MGNLMQGSLLQLASLGGVASDASDAWRHTGLATGAAGALCFGCFRERNRGPQVQ